MRRVLFVLAWALSVTACERETTPPLIEVRELSPRLVEDGDHLVITGTGFPEGKVAHVSFRGDLHRPGAAAVTGVEVDVDTVVGSSTEVELPVNGTLVKLFVGAGDRAAHTTFSGDLTLAFAARAPAAPPVVVTLHDMWLDVRPPLPHKSVEEAEAAEGERTLAFLGVKPDPTPVVSGGILVDAIDAGSRAEGARLLAGDVITEFDGVRVLSIRDLASAPGDRSAWLKVRRGGNSHEEVARVSLVGWKPPPAATLFGPALLLGLATVLVLLFFAPTPDAVAWAERRLSDRLRVLVRGRNGAHVLTARLFGGRSGAPRGATMLVSTLGISTLLAVLPLAPCLGFGGVDAGILVVLSLTALSLLSLGAESAPGSRSSVLAPLRRAFCVVSLGIPAVASVVAVVMMTGSLGMEDIVRGQSGWPWGWTLFRSPLAFVFFLLSFASALVSGSRETSDGNSLPEADSTLSAPSPLEALVAVGQASPRRRLFFFAECVHHLVLSLVFCALFLGGWQIPGLAPEQVQGHFGWTLLGAVLYVAKTWLVIGGTVLARWALPSPVGRPEDAVILAWRWLIPLSLGTLFLTALSNAGGAVISATWMPEQGKEPFVGVVMLGVTCAVVARAVTRVRHVMRQGTAGRAPGMDPFL